MEHTGIVMEIQCDNAVVRFTRSKACGNCKACIMIGDGEAQVSLRNTLGAQVGDKVRVELNSRSFVKANLIVYGLPMALLLAGVLLGNQAGDKWAAIAGLLGAGCGYGLLRLLEPWFARRKNYQPIMVDIEHQ